MSGLRSRSPSDGSLRTGPWRGDGTVALIAPLGGRRVSRVALRSSLDRLEQAGYTSVLTAALAPIDQEPFLELGFHVHEHLHLLAHDLRALPSPSTRRRTRRARRGDRLAVIAIDGAAFPPFWRLDGTGLDDALEATPTVRFRISSGAPDGYAITGRAGQKGYLQRLAVRPEAQRTGVGGVLVLDGLRWAKRWGAREVLVNTQLGNDSALRLYERLGFVRRPVGLVVLLRSLGGA